MSYYTLVLHIIIFTISLENSQDDSVRVPLGETAVSCLYAFLSGKSQGVYEEIPQSIIDGCEMLGLTPDTTEIVIDFEKAVTFCPVSFYPVSFCPLSFCLSLSLSLSNIVTCPDKSIVEFRQVCLQDSGAADITI